MQVRVLGPVEVVDDGPAIAVAGTRLAALLIRLALDAGRVVSTGTLSAAVWPDDPPADEANALQSLVSRLRRTARRPDAVQQAPGGYRLCVAGADVDAVAFEQLAAEGRSAHRAGDPARAEQLLAAADRLWRGPLAEAFPAGDAARLHRLRAEVTAGRIEAQLDLGAAADVVLELEQAVRADPADERSAAALMRALSALGRPAEALAVYAALRARLADELGTDPSPALQQAHLELLRGADGPRPDPVTNLRAPLTSFVGRDAEVGQVTAALAADRLVTVLGPGGAGKTRLAQQAAAGAVERYAGVWLAELAPLTDPSEVPFAVLSALGRRDGALIERGSELPARRSQRDALDLLVDTIGARPTLLVLDNCEHLLDAVAALVDVLLAGCAGLTVLTTSREPIGILGEALVWLSPLAMPAPDVTADAAAQASAVQLFTDRARAARPGFALDEQSVAAVVEIVRRLDGLPLAIELAAAKLRAMPVGDVAARLSDRFGLLTGGSRTALPRHRTLHAVVDWSWELSSDRERLLAERLAVFPGGVTAQCAATVCGDDRLPARDVPDLLGALVDKSLLVLLPGGAAGARYRMLETIREFGVDRLAERGELAAARAAHARHFAAVAHEADAGLRTHEQARWLRRLQAEHDNMVAALRYFLDAQDAPSALRLAVDLAWHWTTILNRHGEAAAWLGAGLALPGEVEPGLRATAEALYAMNRFIELDGTIGRTGQGTQARAELVERAEALLAAPTERYQPAEVLPPIMFFFGARLERAQQTLEAAVAGADPWVRATALAFRARFGENEGDLAGVRRDIEAASALLDQVGDLWQRASLMALVALLRTYDGDLDGAEQALLTAESAAAEIGSVDVDDRLYVLIRLVDVRVRKGDLVAAERSARTALELVTGHGAAPEIAAMAMIMIAGVERTKGDSDAARRWVDRAMEQVQQVRGSVLGAWHGVALVHAVGAILAADRGDLARADELLAEAYEAAVTTRDMPVVASVGVAVAARRAAAGDWPGAVAALGAAAVLRGADDLTDPEIRRIRAAGRAALGERFDRLAADGRTLDRAAALAALDPSRSRDVAVR